MILTKYPPFGLLLVCLLLVSCLQSGLTEQEKSRLMFALLSNNAAEALSEISESNDPTFTPLLIDLLWISGSELSTLPDSQKIVEALERLTGQSFGAEWAAWVAWYSQTDIEPPAAIAEWKGQFFSQIDPQFGDFFAGEVAETFRPEEIVWGGVVVDGIPSLDYLPQVLATEVDGFSPYDAVFGISINGEQRAYPLRVMDWHEMVNDVVGGVPVTIAYCTLCGAAIAYAGETESGAAYDFGSSGLLYRSNKLMYDRQTRSLWNQLTGEPVLGEAVKHGELLRVLPIVLTSLGEWQAQHPDTTILPLETGYVRDYNGGTAYGDYFVSDETRFPVGLKDGRLPAKEQIFALRVNGQAKAYPLDRLIEAQLVHDQIDGQPVLIVSAAQGVNVHGYSYELEYISYRAGVTVRAFGRGERVFEVGELANTLLDEQGGVWQIKEEGLIGPLGEKLPRLAGHLAYWFGWYAAHPNTLLYDPSN